MSQDRLGYAAETNDPITQRPVTTNVSFLLTLYVHQCLVVALFHVVFTLEPKLREQPLSAPLTVTMAKGKRAMANTCWLLMLLPGDDTHPFRHTLLASASHSPLLGSARRLGEAVGGGEVDYLVNIIQSTPVTLFQAFISRLLSPIMVVLRLLFIKHQSSARRYGMTCVFLLNSQCKSGLGILFFQMGIISVIPEMFIYPPLVPDSVLGAGSGDLLLLSHDSFPQKNAPSAVTSVALNIPPHHICFCFNSITLKNQIRITWKR